MTTTAAVAPFKDRDRPLLSHFQSICPSLSDDSNSSRISLFIVIAVAIFGLVSILAIVKRVNAPYLCKKDGITLHCPHVKELPSLWENPYSATTSWKPCAERRLGGISDLLPKNETTGYIFIHAEGGLNQQRIAICNAVAVAKIMNATLILPVLKQDQIWKDQTSNTAEVDALKEEVTTLKGQLAVQDEELKAYAGHVRDLV